MGGRPAPDSSAKQGGWSHNKTVTSRLAIYTVRMSVLDDLAALAEAIPALAERPIPIPDPVADLGAVYRDAAGLKALILRKVRDPEVAADILQDAAVTTLQKLRDGQIPHPENLGGYLYGVALNHIRNYRRKDRTSLTSSDQLEELPSSEDSATDVASFEQRQWAMAARRVLDEMPVARDREILIRFYLEDRDKTEICSEFQLSEDHFKRVIFRARNRFKELLEQRGFRKADLLALAIY
jgi:RNA polymerase sigma-70 factor, ECF subfamily